MRTDDHALLVHRRKTLIDELKQVQAEFLKSGGGIEDYHNPKVKPYHFQEFPKLMYHPTKLNPVIESQRRSIIARNLRQSHADPLDVPDAAPLMRMANDPEEETKARDEGFGYDRPMPAPDYELDAEVEALAQVSARSVRARSVSPVRPVAKRRRA